MDQRAGVAPEGVYPQDAPRRGGQGDGMRVTQSNDPTTIMLTHQHKCLGIANIGLSNKYTLPYPPLPRRGVGVYPIWILADETKTAQIFVSSGGGEID